MTKETVTCTISLHYIQARIIKGLQKGEINLQQDSLRIIGVKISDPNEPDKFKRPESPQRIKHHLDQLVRLGVLNIINGSYNYQKQ